MIGPCAPEQDCLLQEPWGPLGDHTRCYMLKRLPVTVTGLMLSLRGEGPQAQKQEGRG